MKRSKFSDQQIAFVLRQAEEGTAVVEVCGKAGLARVRSTNGANKLAGSCPLR
jgi:putative transposase